MAGTLLLPHCHPEAMFTDAKELHIKSPPGAERGEMVSTEPRDCALGTKAMLTLICAQEEKGSKSLVITLHTR